MTTTIDITLAAEQLEGTKATLSQWLVTAGDAVSAEQPVAELETDKVSIEITAPADGTILEISAEVGAEVRPGQVLGRIARSSTATAQPRAVAAPVATASTGPQSQPQSNDTARKLVGPAVRKLVAQHNLNLDRIPGTGRDGRVTRNDVMAYLDSTEAKPDTPSTTNIGGIPSRKIPHTQMRKTIANHMVESLLHISPHVTSVFEMDMSRIIFHRQQHKQAFADKETNLTFTAYFLAACVKAMQAAPEMNARFHKDALELFDQINIGVGTALGDNGLVVPVVRQVETMDLFDIAQALHQQTERARAGKLTPADMKGGTFTISNHGVSGSLFAAPIIINQPQVAILGVGKMEKRVTVVEKDGDDCMVIKPMCYVSLSIDHRAVDAFQTNAWLSAFVDAIENWGDRC